MSPVKLEPRLLATAIGSMPHTDPGVACSLVLKYLASVPAWPQLPKRSFKEGMYVQCTQGLPGLKLKDEKVTVT